MSLLQIPVDGTSISQSFTTELEGITYTFEIFWVDRDSRWYMNLADVNDDVIVGGVPLSLGVDLLFRFTDMAIPPGILFMFDTTGSDVEAGINDLNSRVLLCYQESTDLPL